MKFDKEKFRNDMILGRVSKGMSLRELSLETGVSPATLNRIERNKNVDMDTFCKCLTWLGKKPKKYISDNL